MHQVSKALAEHGASLDDGEKGRIQAAIKDLEEALKGEDKEAIDARSAALVSASQKLGEKMYADAQAQGAAAQAAGAATGAHAGAHEGAESATAKAGAEDVVDADFKEVKRG